MMSLALEQRQCSPERSRTTPLAHLALFIFLFVFFLFRLAFAGLLVLVARPVLVAFAFLALDRCAEAQIAAAGVVGAEHRALRIVAGGRGGRGPLGFQRH